MGSETLHKLLEAGEVSIRGGALRVNNCAAPADAKGTCAVCGQIPPMELNDLLDFPIGCALLGGQVNADCQ